MKQQTDTSSKKNRGSKNSRELSAEPKEQSEFIDKVVYINRCATVTKGGRRFSFSALVVTGNQKGTIGVGLGKANEVPDAIRKGSENARKNLKTINLKNNTIPHEVFGKSDGGYVFLKPASPGTGLIAGSGIRILLEVLGVKDILTKSLGSNNKHSMLNATLAGLEQLKTEEQIRAIRQSI